MAKKRKTFKYVLTIAHKQGEDRCEYIQEEILADTGSDSWMIGELDLHDYFSESDIAGLTCCEIGKA